MLGYARVCGIKSSRLAAIFSVIICNFNAANPTYTATRPFRLRLASFADNGNSLLYHKPFNAENHRPKIRKQITQHSITPAITQMLGYARVCGIKSPRLAAIFSVIIYNLNAANPTYTATRPSRLRLASFADNGNFLLYHKAFNAENHRPKISKQITQHSITPAITQMLGYARVCGIKSSRLTAIFSVIIYNLNAANPTYTATRPSRLRLASFADNGNSLLYHKPFNAENHRPKISKQITQHSITPAITQMLGYTRVCGIKSSRLTAIFSVIIYNLNAANPTYPAFSASVGVICG
jgi:ribulose bisphosphate carboxylase small subunit